MRIYTDVSVTDLAKPVLVDRAHQVSDSAWRVRLTQRLDAYLSAADARTISAAFAALADDIDAREAATAVTVDTDPTPAHGISRDLGADGRQDGAA